MSEKSKEAQAKARANPNKVCGAKLRGKLGQTCRQFAGIRTDHPGKGRCWLHGGLTRAGKEQLARKKRELEEMRAQTPEFLSTDELALQFARDPDILNLAKEIGIGEAILNKLDKDDPNNYVIVTRLIDSITRAKTAKFNIERDRRYVMSVDEVTHLLQVAFRIVARFVVDEATRNIMMDEIRQSMKVPLLIQGTSGQEQTIIHQ